MRVLAIWTSGAIAAGLAGAILGAAVMPAETYDGKAWGFIFGLIAGTCAFACWRLSRQGA